MTKLIQWALENAPELNRKVLSRLVNEMDPCEAERFTNAVIGLTDIDTELASLPKTIAQNGSQKNLVLLSAHYLQNAVDYSFDEEVVRYFKTQEEADEFTKMGRGRWDGRCSSDGDYKFHGAYAFKDQCSTCTFDEWKEMASE